MKENDLLEKIANVIATTPVTDDLYFHLANRINREIIKPLIDEVKAGYEEMLFAERRRHNDKNH